MKNLSILFLIAFMFVGCDSDDANEERSDYLIFGHFYGMCGGEECVEVFKLTENELYEDSSDDYSLKKFNFYELDQATYTLVKDLYQFIPEQLLKEESDIFGCPDCADGGGLFIELSKDGKLFSWRIDQSKENVPEYLHDFMDKVNEKIALINSQVIF
ncbi:hypothetical protein [Gelidibacter mesophilus]|uniref:hypothetical protein n=1 Tax=Gelidibacter mesophilus TaxID=169050 RepID=UPI000425E60B|nr:hypothetical protein [Gelidibacter mesophilus]